jgi:NitT/TauT family transport system ATP-binding protein
VTVLEVEGLRKVYDDPGGGERVAIERLSFTVAAGELVTVVGPSGCGKTTLLRCLSGLTAPSQGSVTVAGRPVAGPPPELAMVFQDYSRSLLPWMTVERNVAFPLRYQGVRRAERAERAAEALGAVGLDGFARHYPWQLSGGMQQRVAIARALAYRPKVLLMDEPFASVDAQTRADLEDLLLRVWAGSGLTVVLVTHDIDEAVYLADRVVTLTHAPARVAAVHEVGLARPRDQLKTKQEPEFAGLRSAILATIRRRDRAGGSPDGKAAAGDDAGGQGGPSPAAHHDAPISQAP